MSAQLVVFGTIGDFPAFLTAGNAASVRNFPSKSVGEAPVLLIYLCVGRGSEVVVFVWRVGLFDHNLWLFVRLGSAR